MIQNSYTLYTGRINCTQARINYNEATGKNICLKNYDKIKYTRLIKCRLPILQYYTYYFSKKNVWVTMKITRIQIKKITSNK